MSSHDDKELRHDDAEVISDTRSNIAVLPEELIDSADSPDVVAAKLERFSDNEVDNAMENGVVGETVLIDEALQKGGRIIADEIIDTDIIGPFHDEGADILARANALVTDFKNEVHRDNGSVVESETKELSPEEATRLHMEEFLKTAEGEKMLSLLKRIFLEGNEHKGYHVKKATDFEHFKKVIELMHKNFKEQYPKESFIGMPVEILWKVFDEKMVREYMRDLHRINDNQHEQGYFETADGKGMGGDFYRINKNEGKVVEGVAGQVIAEVGEVYFGYWSR